MAISMMAVATVATSRKGKPSPNRTPDLSTSLPYGGAKS